MYIMLTCVYCPENASAVRTRRSARSPLGKRTSAATTCVLVRSLAGFCLVRTDVLPDAGVSCLRHQKDTEHETDGGHHDRKEERVAEAVSRLERRGGDERHQPTAPAIADVIGNRYRGVADPRGEILREKSADRTIDHAHVANENDDDEDGNRIVDVPGLGGLSEPGVQRIVGKRC